MTKKWIIAVAYNHHDVYSDETEPPNSSRWRAMSVRWRTNQLIAVSRENQPVLATVGHVVSMSRPRLYFRRQSAMGSVIRLWQYSLRTFIIPFFGIGGQVRAQHTRRGKIGICRHDSTTSSRPQPCLSCLAIRRWERSWPFIIYLFIKTIPLSGPLAQNNKANLQQSIEIWLLLTEILDILRADKSTCSSRRSRVPKATTYFSHELIKGFKLSDTYHPV